MAPRLVGEKPGDPWATDDTVKGPGNRRKR